MFEAGPHVFTLPPGVDFAGELVRGLQERLIGAAPEAMARVRLFVNSQRMRMRVIEAFTASGALLLPRISVVTDLDQDPVLAGMASAVTPLRRRLDLARLIGGLLETQPDLAPRSALFDLADSLAKLLGEMQEEGVTTEAIAGLDVSGHSAHWARSQAFLSIVAPLMADQTDGPARHREAAIRLAKAWQLKPPADPVIVAGSTGSRGATAILMQAVAELEQGAVVLPGFDTDLPEAVWEAMADPLTSEDHPQFRFRRLMDALGLTAKDLAPWRRVQPADPDRNRLISLSLRPAPITDQWLVEGPGLPDLLTATRDLTLIEAAGPRDEALAIALILRQAVESGQRAALITPDRELTRRVAAALDLWRIIPDDSAGRPLALSAPGRLLRHVAAAFGRALTLDGLLTLLKHPLAGSGAGRLAHLELTRALEMDLRRHGPAFPEASDILAWSEKRREPDASAWGRAFAPVLNDMLGPAPETMAGHVRRHLRLAEQLARGTDPDGAGSLWQTAAGETALALMQLLVAEAPHGGAMTAATYRDLFETMIQQGEVRESYPGHPLIAFYGPREAREMRAELVILGGLTDGTWPGGADPDPWLNRRMRKDAGLLVPERQNGLSAHDYQQAVAAPKVVLTRALRNAEAETVPSRWLNRLGNLMLGLPDRNGPEAWASMRARGLVWLMRAAALEAPTPAMLTDPRLAAAPRPAPQPPVGDRPARLSLSRISTLIRDPYAIYASYILRLRPLDPLRPLPDPRDRGSALHEVLEVFVKDRPEGESRAEARRRLLATAEKVISDHTPFPSARLLWLARLNRAADHVLRRDSKHGGQALVVEEQGSIRLFDPVFQLYGTPDRIDQLPDGRLHLIDYKSGAPPSEKQQRAFDNQLLLAAAMAERGGFAGLGQREVALITYIGLGAGEKAVESQVPTEELDLYWARFIELITRYSHRSQGYAARRAVFELRYPLDYDHLSRFGEWQMSDRAQSFPVGKP